MQKVSNIEHLKQLLTEGKRDFFIALGGGMLRSSKTITPLADGMFEVFSGVDGSVVTFTESQMLTETNIGKALERGAFFAD